MKVRKLAVALALAGGLGSGVAQALGLGEIELQSYLNEPMDAEIVLPQSRGVDPGDVFVNIAPERAYQRLGLERSQFLGKLRFDVTTRANGSLVVNVSSREPLREPYLNFLLELTWPNGRLMREYAVLVDPPVYAEESGVSESVRAPSNAQSRPAPSARSSESVRRQAQVEQSSGSGYRSDTFGPTGPSDTLWTIASAVRPDNSLSMQQVMLALQDLNPDAFIGSNINRLKRGQVLRVPTANQIRRRSPAEAIQIVAQQNQEFQKPKRTVGATPAQQPEGGGAGEVAASGDELKLLVADDKGGRSETEGGSAGGDSQLAGGVDAGAAVAMEELESARRENDELNSRVDDLQDQVKTLQRLIELKNNQLAEVQQGAAVSDAAAQDAPMADADGAVTDQAETVADATEQGVEASQTEVSDVAATADDAASADIGASEAPSESEQEGVSSETEVAEAEIASDAQPVADDAGTDQNGDVARSDVASVAGDQTKQPAQAEVPEAKAQPKTEPVVDKGFPGNVIDAITGNTMYQIALGGGLILLLLLLLLLARRSANREKAFYEQLNSDTDGPDDSFDLSLDDDEPEQSQAGDALEEADAYVAYGRYDQAGEVLETAISREPSRTDLRLKLLGVYADNQDRQSFEKQFGEVEALDDDEAIAQANELRSRLEEAESMPSIDDLESQLRSGSFVDESEASNEFEADEPEQRDSEFSEIDSAFANFDLDASDDVERSTDTDTDTDTDEEEAKDGDDGLIEYDLSGLELPETETEAKAKGEVPEDVSEEESDFSSLEIDLDEPEADEPLGDSLDDSLDESFLDELDAELDKVAGEDEELGGSEMEESTLDDLELDVSDEDLALMEEFSDSADSANAGFEGDELTLDDELELEDNLHEDDLNDDDLKGIESLGDLTEESDDALVDEELPVASDEVRDEAPKSPVPNLDEDDLGDDDDFDFLAGTDEAATKLDLARAYIEMGDSDGARDILEEVALEGDDEQKSEAQDLLKNLS